MKIKKTKKHLFKRWEVSIMEFKSPKGKVFKVTKKFPNLPISETKFIKDSKRAKKQFDKWLQE